MASRIELIRLVRQLNGEVVLDPTCRIQGRGAYVHRDPSCVSSAIQRKLLDRALKRAVPGAVVEHLLPGGKKP